ncbi:MAG TPA: DUF2784 domain-containing protein [Fimbriimonadaceae bacterium]|nr:DUF2784 domain-containing protein [Fimbriimonadaceae bacterium]
MFWLHVADIGLIVFHTALVAFNCVGWVWRKTRPWHLATMSAVLFSWLILGIWFGFGYCLCTDLHWRVREALGQHVTEQTYIQYLIERLTGWRPDADLASNATAAVFVIAFVLSIGLNLRDRKALRR